MLIRPRENSVNKRSMLTLGETTCNSFFFISSTLFYSVVLCFQKLIIPEFISPCSSYALSIVLIGVADGRWEDMRKFDDKIPKREFDNFQVSSHSLFSVPSVPIPFSLILTCSLQSFWISQRSWREIIRVSQRSCICSCCSNGDSLSVSSSNWTQLSRVLP